MTFDLDLWPWLLIFDDAHTHAKDGGQRSVGSDARLQTVGLTDGHDRSLYFSANEVGKYWVYLGGVKEEKRLSTVKKKWTDVLLSSRYSVPDGCGEVLWWPCLCVCLSACSRAYLQHYTSDLHQIFGLLYTVAQKVAQSSNRCNRSR